MLTDIQFLQIKNSVMRILRVPGNYNGGILEMAIVADYHMSLEELNETSKKLASALKQQNEIFRNVRLNLIKWVSDELIIKEVSLLPSLQMGRTYEDYEQYTSFERKEQGGSTVKTLDVLLYQLKLFYARSKVIIVLTDGSYRIADEKKAWEHLNPFLRKKLLIVQPTETQKIKFVSYVEYEREKAGETI